MRAAFKKHWITAFVLACFFTALSLSACGGSSAVGPAPTPGQPQPSPSPTISGSVQVENASQDGVNGVADMFTPASGDTASGGNGSLVDGISCDPTMSNNYHIHVFVGFFINGVQYAMPIALGMVNPAAPVNGYVSSATCFYHIHTHQSSGVVHIEDPDPSGAPRTASLYTLKDFFDVWGITVDRSHVGPFSGPLLVVTSGQVYTGSQNNGVVPSSTYHFYGGDPNAIPLYSHEVIWLLVGPNYPPSLDGVSFYTQY
jgi:hypothetical protein